MELHLFCHDDCNTNVLKKILCKNFCVLFNFFKKYLYFLLLKTFINGFFIKTISIISDLDASIYIHNSTIGILLYVFFFFIII